MFGLKILKMAKLGLLSSVVFGSLLSVNMAHAGDVYRPADPKPDYPAPVMPPMVQPVPQPIYYPPIQFQRQYQGQGQFQGQGQGQFQGQGQASGNGGFIASIDISATYNRYTSNSAFVGTDQIFAELRPYFGYSSDLNGVQFTGSFYTTLTYEFGGTPPYGIGRSEVDLLIKKEGDFAAGVTAGYDKNGFVSASPSPISGSSYQTIDVSGFAEKRLGQFGVSLTGSYVKETYAATAQTGGGSYSEADKDHSVYGGALRLNYHFDQSLAAFVEGSYTRKKYVITPTPNRNETAYGIRVGGTFNFSNTIALEVAGQYGYHLVECGCQTTAFGGDAKLVVALGGNVSGSIFGEGEYTKSTDPILDSVSMRIGGDISFQAAANLELSAGAEYAQAFSGPNEGKDLSVNANIRYGITSNIDIFAGAQAGHSSKAGVGYTRNYGATVGLSLHN